MARRTISVSISSWASPSNSRPIQSPCCSAIVANTVRPSGVIRMIWTRRSVGEGVRVMWPLSSSRSTRAVTLPAETISRFETSPRTSPSSALSSWASRSKRGSVKSNSSRSRRRTSPSIRLEQVSSLSHSRNSAR
nr:hypothetical protein [Segnochrobactrum spirostomi]